jgi:hypothetical protein
MAAECVYRPCSSDDFTAMHDSHRDQVLIPGVKGMRLPSMIRV